MLKVANSLLEEYIPVLKLKNFCSDHKMQVSDVKVDLFNRVIEYAGDDENAIQYRETYDWILDTIKSGSKEFCIRRIYIPDDSLRVITKIIASKYDECPKRDILLYKNTERFDLADYMIEYADEGKIVKVSFLFSGLVLEGSTEYESGDRIIYPIYVDIYVEEGFIVARYKPKTTIYSCNEENIIYKDNSITPLYKAIELIENLSRLLKLQPMDINPTLKWQQMLYSLYLKYSFTPADIQKKIDSMQTARNEFIELIFNELGLKEVNKKKAKEDLDIFLEKFISINGNMERIFKEDRMAYLVKITSDDALQMTRIDTTSAWKRPLQCSDAFFDGKKSILKTKACEVLHLCYNRKRKYLDSFTVQMTAKKGFGIVKMRYIPEEEDIQNVLQRIFENY